ncbi:(d)CMP kinase [Enterovirga aerilata]|uniref:Cytidylate kinase n=1 Tax=Enterovirga aerilata TaxID=2730920 RepID=A0A849HUB2_9HYPH|nr:(d)CMP kinase [Enterovirga sp. DB1703]NNM71096.1 (d)CMP kinase [Enterovirga sp. DB1703]
MVIAIDGPAASGKGTLARRLARHLGRPHLDTGLLYRAVARDMLDREEPLSDAALAARAAAALDTARLDDPRLRSREMGEAASIVSTFAAVRETLLGFQRRFARQEGGAVLDGRDIGTVVCPDADLKLYVTASPEERARRRQRELAQTGEPSDFETVLADIRRRDARDQGRPNAPLRMAEDAVLLDTTALDADAAFAEALRIVRTRLDV